MRWLAAILTLLSACSPVEHARPVANPLFGVQARGFLTAPSVIEVRPSAGKTADTRAVNLMAQRLREAGGDPTVRLDAAAPTSLALWDRGALDAFERTYRADLGPDVIFIAWLGGRSALGASVVAETFSPHSVAVFPDGRHRDESEEALVHELGHVLGLVRTPRMDSAHPFHDVSPKCVMFYRTAGVTDFCGPCKGDLAATAGR